MSVASKLESLLTEEFAPQFLTIDNESHMHSGPATESHFKVTLVSARFDGMRAVARHQAVYRSVAELMQNPIHALALHLYTEQEWQEKGQVSPASPTCRGGSKAS
ncbi:BolA family transcriptional regulator [Pokkaliibacter sp. MBI-7]|uniref:BolA family protein n=1 Tax=Pokkaliibacter sp. MBI-7 TaxID=3040600 RepID=UPI002447BA09|nr:BolA family transcriptional regulator [Pokkaliibacter sp. MBI-7]MDH2435884.1 BolA family transcriptional regulator [Pokkaliibacter sp. MBI-7]